MARPVKVSSIGAVPPAAPCGDTTPDALNRRMTGFWRDEINQVLPDKPDLIVLPELCDRFSNLAPQQVKEQRAARGDSMLEFLQSVARENRCYIAYPTARLAGDGSWRNAALMIDRRGEVVGEYDKNHPVVTETTEMDILCGAAAPLIECDFGRVAFAICFDLNFDELRLKYKAAHPDLIVFPSMYHGGIMQPYWAYSCRAHFVGCVGINKLPSEI
jgi:predicted amidohydrolase